MQTLEGARFQTIERAVKSQNASALPTPYTGLLQRRGVPGYRMLQNADTTPKSTPCCDTNLRSTHACVLLWQCSCCSAPGARSRRQLTTT